MAYEENRTPLKNPLSPIRLEYYQLKLSRDRERASQKSHKLQFLVRIQVPQPIMIKRYT